MGEMSRSTPSGPTARTREIKNRLPRDKRLNASRCRDENRGPSDSSGIAFPIESKNSVSNPRTR